MALTRRKFLKAAGSAAAAGVLTGCAGVEVTIKERPAPSPADPKNAADLVLRNGNILTVDAQDHIAQGVAVAQGKIQKVGTNQEVSALIGPHTKVVNLKGYTVTPGIIDAHNHMMYYGEQMKYQVDIRPPKVKEKKDLLRVVEAAAKTKKPGEWIYGCQGFPMNLKDAPTRWELDEVSPKNPVYLPNSSGQFAVVNSLALKLGEVDKNTPQPPGGRIEKDERTGEPTGRLMQYPAEDLVRRKAPKPSEEGYEEAVRHAGDLFLPWGITSVQDVIVYLRQHTNIYEKMADKQTLPVRIYILEYVDSLKRAQAKAAQHPRFHGSRCTFGGWKLAIDGGPTAGTTLMYDKNHPGSARAFPLYKPEEFNKIVKILHQTGLQISIHVIGDEGMDLCLDAYEKAIPPASASKYRHRLEHANFPTARNLDRMAKLGIIASVQPSWIFLSGDNYRSLMGEEIAKRTIPNRSFLNRGIPVCFSSDVPATMLFEPFWAFMGAVTRKTRSGHLLSPQEAITMKEALRAYTYTAAYAAFEEKEKGSIEPGKYADLAVWEQDLYNVRSELREIRNLKVVMTILDGKIVYQDAKAKLAVERGEKALSLKG